MGRSASTPKSFWKRVAKGKGCWHWLGALNRDGYGTHTVNFQSWRAHRYAWYLANRRLPTALILHKCNTRDCVNPKHLYEGTHSDNMQDAIRAGTFFGLKCKNRLVPWATKLTPEAVRAIRKSSERAVVLAKQFGVTTMTIYDVKRRKFHNHITD